MACGRRDVSSNSWFQSILMKAHTKNILAVPETPYMRTAERVSMHAPAVPPESGQPLVQPHKRGALLFEGSVCVDRHCDADVGVADYVPDNVRRYAQLHNNVTQLRRRSWKRVESRPTAARSGYQLLRRLSG